MWSFALRGSHGLAGSRAWEVSVPGTGKGVAWSLWQVPVGQSQSKPAIGNSGLITHLLRNHLGHVTQLWWRRDT